MGILPKIKLFTDGACVPNPGPGGYASILKTTLPSGEYDKELAGGYRLTTNSRMELMAVVVGLDAIKSPSEVEVFSDNRYVVDGVAKGWAEKWRAHGWRISESGKPGKGPLAKNRDLWERLLRLCERHTVTFRWIKGHSGHPENERCDGLAKSWARGPNLPEDVGYSGLSSTMEPMPPEFHS